jgi:leucyl-tRNA---protein transferase
MELMSLRLGPEVCSYLPSQQSIIEARIVLGMSGADYGAMLARGWRRFGCNFFRPRCEACQECRSIRVEVDAFRPSRSQRRALRRNRDIRVEVGAPGLTAAKLDLYQRYHRDMAVRRGWPDRRLGAEEYWESYVLGAEDFGREFQYWRGEELVGVGLVDVLPEALSSVYFYHAPEWRALAPGHFSVLTELAYARQHGQRYLYLGYWIEANGSMSYKARFKPHQLLAESVESDQVPRWAPPASGPRLEV